MAFGDKTISNVKSLTASVGSLIEKVNQLSKAFDNAGKSSQKIPNSIGQKFNTNGGHYGLTQGATRPGTGVDGASFPTVGGGRNSMAYSLGAFNLMGGYPGMGGYGPSRFPYPGMPPMTEQQISGYGKASMGMAAFKFGAGVVGGALDMIPGLNQTMQRTYGYYQAGLKVPGINRGQLERATFGAMRGGLSGVGSDAQVAAILASMGYTPGSKNYLQAAGQVGGAYNYLGMGNAAAAQAIGGLQTGPMAANLFQYGITTFNPATGKEKTPGQIARDLMQYMTGGQKVTSEQVRMSYQKGALGANLRNMGFSADQQSIIYQAMLDISSGRNPDLQKASPVKGNENTFLTAQGRLNASTTDVMMAAEDKMIKGFENAADTVEFFNRQVKHAADALGYIKGYTQGVSGTPAGKGAGRIAKNVIGGAMVVGGILAAPFTEGMSLFATAAGVGMMGGGGSGYGASFGVANRKRRGGGSPASGAAVTAGYGATDSSSGSPWASTNGAHTGIDYEMPVGTPVKSSFDGIVSAVDLNSDYGTSVMIDTADGTQAIYAHLSEKRVKVGDQIMQGQVIGKSGESGNAGGPHLHFEIRDAKNHPIDPSSTMSGNLFSNFASIMPTGVTGSSGSAGGPILGTGDQQAWAKDFLTRLGKPLTDDNVSAMTTWMAFEGGHWKNNAHYNPLNTTLNAAGAGSINSVGVRSYQSYEQGMQATLDTIRANKYGYPAILDALSNGSDYQGVINAVNQSKWGTHIKGGATTGYGAAIQSAPISEGNKTVNVTLKIERASEQEAMQFAKKVKYYLDHDSETSMIGSS